MSQCCYETMENMGRAMVGKEQSVVLSFNLKTWKRAKVRKFMRKFDCPVGTTTVKHRLVSSAWIYHILRNISLQTNTHAYKAVDNKEMF